MSGDEINRRAKGNTADSPPEGSSSSDSEGSEPISKSSPTVEEPAGFPIVGVGASAGGLEALKELLSNLPIDTGMAFLIVTHQHPGHTSLLPELLGEAAAIPVEPASEGLVVKPDHIYVAPPGGLLSIMNRKLHRLEASSEEAKHLPIDSFLRSLAEDQHERAICIILSGTGTDGTLGLKAIKGESGMAMVQLAASAQYAGMPSSAAGTGLADYILPPAAMARQLVDYAKGPFFHAPSEDSAVDQEPLQRILLTLRNRTGHDFSGYKLSTIRRRIERRLNVHGINHPEDYLRFLQEDPQEIEILFKELLISVTSFFRDPKAFESLEKELCKLITSHPDHPSLRVWVPGCATGEECYSLAILLREAMLQVDRHFEVQIFGTDLDADAIQIARAGHYPHGIASDVSPERLERFFVREESGWRVRKEVREMCIFAHQNVIKDAPFTRMDLVSCRNLMIYLGSDLQKRLLPLFHYALKPGGLLFLGPSESISGSEQFEALDSKWKIFRCKENTGAARSLPELPFTASHRATAPEAERAARTSAPPIPSQIERLLLNWYCPASLVVNEHGEIIHIHGRTGDFLEPAAGHPRMNVLEMAREGLQLELSHALRQTARGKSDQVRRENVAVQSGDQTIHVDLRVTRIHDPESLRGLFVITLRPVPALPKTASGKKHRAIEPSRIAELERELKFTRESHQSTIEELETSNEELKSTNEELQSTNEELQSTNEELETSKEEMQSLNEELTTVNAELQSKVEALARTNDDMQNLLNSTDIATVFLDNKLHIKRYTEKSRTLIKLIPGDVGRPLGDLVSKLDYNDLVADCDKVFRTLNSREVEVRTHDGHWYLMRIIPYRTSDNAIDGLVLTFVEISKIHRAVELAHSYFESIVQIAREPLVVLSSDLRVEACNSSFAKLFGSDPEAVEDQPLFEISGGVWDVLDLRRLLNEILPQNHSFKDFRFAARFPEDGERVFILNARRLEGADEQPAILLAMEEQK